VHRVSQPEKDGLVRQRFEPVTVNRGNEEVDRVGTQVDGGRDGPGRVRPVQCRFLIRLRGGSSG
jgi:hypothetical protein